MDTLTELFLWAQSHPWYAAALGLYLLLTLLGNVRLDEATATRYPRLAAAWVVAQKVGAVGRGVLKPIVGLVVPSAAKEVVSQLYPGTFSGPPTTPRNDGRGGA